jgi:hypothetical protein
VTNEEARAAKARAEAYDATCQEYERILAQPIFANNSTIEPHARMQAAGVELLAAARTDVPALVDALLEARAELAREVGERFLHWRGVERPCGRCGGTGSRSYANSTGWRGGAGGQSITTDICDGCWGTGDADDKGVDLRKLERGMADMSRRLSEMAKLARREHVMGEPTCNELCLSRKTGYDPKGYDVYGCDCGADEHNAKVQALLKP